MTKTDAKYFNTLKNDLVNGLIQYELNGQSVRDYEHFLKYEKEWAEMIKPFFDRIIRNYEKGLITRDESFKEMIEEYTSLIDTMSYGKVKGA